MDRGIQFHSAIDDVYATGLLLEYCLKHYLTVVADERPAELEAKVINAKYFVNPQKKSMRRLIVYTSLGEIYYDAVNKGWGIKNNSEMARSTFDRLDLDKIEADLLQRYRYPSLDTLIRKMEFLYRNNS